MSIYTRLISLLTLTAYLASSTAAWAAASPAQATTVVHQGDNFIDIYSKTFPNDDGDNHYIHIEINQEQRYVFEYCKGGVSLADARKGTAPKTRDCSVTIGNKAGYTQAEVLAELHRMRSQASSDFWWGLAGDVTAGLVVFLALSAIEYFSGGTAAPAAAGGQAISGAAVAKGVSTIVTHTAIKNVMINGAKIVVSTFLGVFVSQVTKAQAERKLDDQAFSTPYEQNHLAKEIAPILQKQGNGNNDVIIGDSMQTFELDLSQIFGKIQ